MIRRRLLRKIRMFSEFWFLDPDGNQHGPVEREVFIRLIREGKVGWETQIWAAGLRDWQTVGQVEGLARLFEPRIAPPSRRIGEDSISEPIETHEEGSMPARTFLGIFGRTLGFFLRGFLRTVELVFAIYEIIRVAVI